MELLSVFTESCWSFVGWNRIRQEKIIFFSGRIQEQVATCPSRAPLSCQEELQALLQPITGAERVLNWNISYKLTVAWALDELPHQTRILK